MEFVDEREGERRRLIERTPTPVRINNHTSDTHFEVNRERLYIVYTRRWLVLAVIFVLSFSNAVMWICFAPIADHVAEFYNITLDQVNWFALVYPIAAIPFSIVASWVIDNTGLRAAIILSSLANLGGAALRLCSAYDVFTPVFVYPGALTGQVLSACAQPVYLIAPAKVAAVWFRDNQRATANMIASMANPLGILVASVVAPTIVTSKEQIPFLLLLVTIPAGAGFVMAMLGVCSSTPPTPPTSSAEESSYSFWTGVKKVMRDGHFILLSLCFGAGVAFYTSLSGLIQQILCPWGYSDEFVGISAACMIGGGIIGAAMCGVVADKTKKFEEVAKICLSCAVLACIAFALIFQYERIEYIIGAVLVLFGTFGFALYPICLELGVESTFPVAEATSAGVLVISGQIQSVIYMAVMQSIAPEFTPDLQDVCGGQATLNYRYPLYIFTGIMVLVSISFTSLYGCKYKRLKTEEQIDEEKLTIHRNQRLYTHPVFS